MQNKCYSTLQSQSLTGQEPRAQSENVFCEGHFKKSRKRPLSKKQFKPFSNFWHEPSSPLLAKSQGDAVILVRNETFKGNHPTKRQGEIKSGLQGLKGGGNEALLHHNILGLSRHLKLENLYATNACYLNSSLQLFGMTEYAQYILGLQIFQEHQNIYKALSDIYTGKEDSVKNLRKLIAHFTQKNYYDNNSQQDSVEFLEDLEAALYNEIGLNGVCDAHWGSEELTMHFSGNEDGRCLKGHMHVSMNQEFFFS